MDPLVLSLKIAEGIAARAEKANANQDDCKVLANLAAKASPLLRQLEQRPVDTDPLLLKSLELVLDALRETEDVIDVCTNSTYFVGWICAKKHNDMLRQTAQKLEFALSQIQIATVGMTADINENLSLLMADLHTAKFEQTAAYVHQTRALQENMERVYYNSSREGIEEMKAMIAELLSEHSKTIEDRMKDFSAVEGYIAEAKKTKSAQEEFELQQIIEVIVDSLKGTSNVDSSFDLEHHLRCPITAEIMNDPVILKDSSITYERAAIENWMERGHRRDPVTQAEISSGILVTNTLIKSLCELQRDITCTKKSERVVVECSSSIGVAPGIYEAWGSGKNLEEQVTQTFTVLVLDPDGSVQGYRTFEDEEEQTLEVSIFQGNWNATTAEISYDDDYLSFFGQIDVDDSILQTTFSLEGEGKPTEGSCAEQTRYSFERMTLSNLLCHYTPQPGLLQCDGIVTDPGCIEFQNRLVLALHASFSVRGWMYLKSVENEFAASHVKGAWTDSGEISLLIYFPVSKEVPLNSMISPKRYLVAYKMRGQMLDLQEGRKLKSPVFSGGVRQVDAKSKSTLPFAGIGQATSGTFEYSDIRMPCRGPCPCVLEKMTPLRLPSEPARRINSGVVFIETSLPHRRKYVAWALESCLVHYEAENRHNRRDEVHVFGSWSKTEHGSMASVTSWKLEPTEDPEALYIRVHNKNHERQQNNAIGNFLTILPQTYKETSRYPSCHYITEHENRQYACTWKAKSVLGDKIVLSVAQHNHPDCALFTDWYIAMPTEERDQIVSRWHNLFAPITSKRDRAMLVKFTYLE